MTVKQLLAVLVSALLVVSAGSAAGLAATDAGQAATDTTRAVQQGNETGNGTANATGNATVSNETGNASITFENQTSNGTAVTVQNVTLPEGGFVEVTSENGFSLGNSTYLESGTQSNVTVQLDDPIAGNQTLTVFAHRDANGNQQFDGVGVGNESDEAYTLPNGSAVTAEAFVNVTGGLPDQPANATAGNATAGNATNVTNATAGNQTNATANATNVTNATANVTNATNATNATNVTNATAGNATNATAGNVTNATGGAATTGNATNVTNATAGNATNATANATNATTDNQTNVTNATAGNATNATAGNATNATAGNATNATAGNETAATANVTFENQTSNGTAVTVQNVTMSEGGFVAIHESMDGQPGTVVGASDYLEAGTHENVTVRLYGNVSGANFTQSRLTANATLIAMPHLDTNGNQSFDFLVNSTFDGPYTANGSAVTDAANVTVSNATAGNATNATANATGNATNATDNATANQSVAASYDDDHNESDGNATLEVPAEQSGNGTSLNVTRASADGEYYVEVEANGTLYNTTTAFDVGEEFTGALILEPELENVTTVEFNVTLNEAGANGSVLAQANTTYTLVNESAMENATADAANATAGNETTNETANATAGAETVVNETERATLAVPAEQDGNGTALEVTNASADARYYVEASYNDTVYNTTTAFESNETFSGALILEPELENVSTVEFNVTVREAGNGTILAQANATYTLVNESAMGNATMNATAGNATANETGNATDGNESDGDY